MSSDRHVCCECDSKQAAIAIANKPVTDILESVRDMNCKVINPVAAFHSIKHVMVLAARKASLGKSKE